jgi:hypothetical protein
MRTTVAAAGFFIPAYGEEHRPSLRFVEAVLSLAPGRRAGQLGPRIGALGLCRSRGADKSPKLPALVTQGRETWTDLPPDYLEEYGFAVLERTVSVNLPGRPAFVVDGVVAGIPNPEGFATIDAAVAAAGTFPAEIDRLFALFYVTVKTVEFDLEAARSGAPVETNAEALFAARQTTAPGFVCILMELATRSGLKDLLGLREFPCVAKFLSYNSLAVNPDQPKPVRLNHTAVLVDLDGTLFVCEPTRASLTGNLRANFLIPLDRSLHTYFTADNARGVTFPQFLKQMIFCEDEDEFDCRHESCPFDRLRVKSGTKKFYFSCSCRVARASAQLEFSSGKAWQLQSRYLVGCRFIGPPVNGRRQFLIGLSFPKPGQYRCTVYLDGMAAVIFHPYAVVGSPQLTGLQEMDDRFDAEIVAPDKLLTESLDGQMLVWLRILDGFTQCRVKTVRIDAENFEPIAQERDITECAKTSVVDAHDEEGKVDLKVAIAFPFAGMQRVTLALPDGVGDGFMDALSLFVNAREAHRGEVETPEALLARGGGPQ